MACTDYCTRRRCRHLALLLVLAVAMLHGPTTWSGMLSPVNPGIQATAASGDTDCCPGLVGSATAACVLCLSAPPAQGWDSLPMPSGGADFQRLDHHLIQRVTVPPLRPPITG
ncbi:hypothetical protein [Sedimenticola hydrogenitrophicus]|uniref:hypothetical protein n=1 Tax=Sedimenticola hydrogenitrophicus TaxID=2967975 RepID=UPI0023B0DC72|nr:hypothetical protein [Sedimenticola hydrogenitrophicus]